METTKNIKNDLFKRKEICFILESDKNPSFVDMRKKIAEDFKEDEESVDVYGIKGSFGSNKFKVDAYVYDSKEDLQKAKQLTQKQRKEIKKSVEDAKKAGEEAKKKETEGLEQSSKSATEEAKAAAEKPAEETKN